MNTAILVIANIGLFIGFFVGGFIMLSFATSKIIGFQQGARALVFTPGDARSQRKHRALLALALAEVVFFSALFFYLGGQEVWSAWALAPTLGLMLGEICSFLMDRSRLKPNN